MTKRRTSIFPHRHGWLFFAVLILTATVQPATAQDTDAFYESALVRFDNGDLEGSLIDLKNALRGNANLLPGHILLARIFLKIGKGAAAQKSLHKTQRLGGDALIIAPLLAESLLQQRKLKELVSQDIDPGLPPEVRSQLLVTRAKALIGLGNIVEAEAGLEEAVELAPQAVAPRVAFVTLALRKDDLQTASMHAGEILRLAPDDADAWYVSGSVTHALGDLELATEAYDRALALDPAHYDTRLSRAGVLVDQRRYDEASKDIKYLREHHPLDPLATYLDSVYLAQHGRKQEARAALLRAATLLDDIPAEVVQRSHQLQLLAGIANFELERFEQAQTYLSDYMKRYPHQAGPRKIAGAILARQGRADKAIEVLKPALQMAPNDSRLLALLGTTYMQNGHHEVASSYLDKAVRLSGGSPQLKTQLALSRIAQGFEDQGLRELAAVFEQDPRRNAQTGVVLAVAYLKANRAEAARAVVDKLADVLPDNLTVLNLLASSQLSLGRREEAELAYARILQIDPDFMPAGVNLAMLEASRGQLGAAAARLESMLEKNPQSVRILMELSKVEERAGRIESALRWMQKAKNTDTQSTPAVVGLVDLHLRMNEPELALRVAREADSWARNNLRMMAALGRAQVALERVDLASDVYERMASVAGYDVGELYEIARLQLAIDAGPDAIYTLNKALRLDPSHVPSRALLVEAELRYQESGRALSGARRLLEDHPELALSHRLVGDTLSGAGQHVEAVASYRRAFELEPTSAHVLTLYQARRRSGEGLGARALLVDWIERHPGDGLTRMALAESYLAAGDLVQARAHYEAVLVIAPDTAQVLNNLAYILDRLGEPGAIGLARRAQLAAPNDPAVGDTLGWMLVRQGDPAQGLKYLRDAQSRASSSLEIRYHVGAALAALDRDEEARRELRRAVAASVDFEGADDARTLLRELGG